MAVLHSGMPTTFALMEQLIPPSAEAIDIDECYLNDVRLPHDGRPWLVVNMAMTADGATALAGRSGGIGGAADRRAFHALRSAADVILVGAGTARAENYGPVQVPEHHVAARALAGREAPARLAIVTARCDLDPMSRLFEDPGQKPMIFTTEVADPPVLLEDRAEIIRCGYQSVDVHAMLSLLGERGVRSVICEGGPSLNGHLLSANLVDEWCVTISAQLASGSSSRAAHGQDVTCQMVLGRLIVDGTDLLARYVTARQ